MLLVATMAATGASDGADPCPPVPPPTLPVPPSPPPSGSGQHAAFASMLSNHVVDLDGYRCTDRAGDQHCGEITDYSRLIYDAAGHHLLMFGGGHAATFRDDVERLTLGPESPLVWTPDQPPTPCSAMTLANMDRTHARWISTGHPFARHTYDMLVMTPTEMVMLAGSSGRGGCAPQGNPDPFFMQGSVHHYDPVAKTWRVGGSLGNWAPYAQAEYDPPSGMIVVIGYNTHAGAGTIWLYDPESAMAVNTGVHTPDVGYGENLIYFPPNQRHYLIKGDTVFEVILNRATWGASTITRLSTTGTAPGQEEVGYAYDATSQLIGGAIVRGVMRFFNPATAHWTSRTLSPGTVGTMAFHAIDYDPINNVYIFLTDAASGRRTWAYRY